MVQSLSKIDLGLQEDILFIACKQRVILLLLQSVVPQELSVIRANVMLNIKYSYCSLLGLLAHAA